MKKFITLATLLQLSTVNASVVAIMDTGTDLSHKDIAAKAWINKNEKEGSTTDLDGSGLAGDMHGWDFTENSAKVFNDKYNYLINDDVKKFYTLFAKYELKTINETEFAWLKGIAADKAAMNKIEFVGGYAHGTHVGGIAAINNPKAQVMSLKILPTVYEELKANDPKQAEFDFAPASGTFEELKQAIITQANDQVNEMVPLSTYLKFHKVDVVNQSFGIGFTAAAAFLTAAYQETLKKDPSDEELVEMIILYFNTLQKNGPAMFKASPETLFVIASGNDGSDNDKLPDYPSVIQADNKIVVAATLGYSSIADFSNFGATKVDVAAPGVAIQSIGPAQTTMWMSGTSQAAPYVTSAISLAKDMNPALKAADLKSIILKTVDVKPWLKGKVATSGIVNKARVLRAAELSKTMNVEVAINKARVEIADVAVTKSNARRLPGMKLNYKPLRPSLLVKRPSL